MGDDILSHQTVDIYSDLRISPSQSVFRKKKELPKNRKDKDGATKFHISPQDININCRNFAEENFFDVLANHSVLQKEVLKTQLTLNDEIIAIQVSEREKKQKQAITYQKLLEEVEKLRQSNHQKEDKIYHLVVQNSNLKKNICSLYKTAKSEVEQKNCLLLDANEERDRLRRKISKMNNIHQFEHESLAVKPLEVSRIEKEKSRPSHVDLKRENSEDCKFNHRKRYCDHKEKDGRDFKSDTNRNSSIRFNKKEVQQKCIDIATKKSSLSKHQCIESKMHHSKKHETSTVKQKSNIEHESSKLCLISKATKQTNAKKIQDKSKNKNTKDNVVYSCFTNNTAPADMVSRRSVAADQNIESKEYKQIAKSNSGSTEQKFDKKQKCFQNLIPDLPTHRKYFENEDPSVLNKAEQSKGFSCLSACDGNKNLTDDLPVKEYETNFLNDKTTTNALFFGLLPIGIREKFLEYEQRLIKIIENLKQNFVNYCLNSAKSTLLGLLPEVINQTFIDYEQRLIVATNRFKQTFVYSCLTHSEKDAQKNSVPTLNKKQLKTSESLTDNNETDSNLPPQKQFKFTKNLDSNQEPNKFPLLEEMDAFGVNEVHKNELQMECENNEASTKEENVKNHSQNDDKNSDSTQKVPSYYREMFLLVEKKDSNFINKTSSLNSALVNPSKDDESVSSKNVTFDSITSYSDQSDSNTVNTKPLRSVPFHPSLSSVYYRRQLLKAAIQEKAEKGLCKSTKENIHNLYRYRKTKIPIVCSKKELDTEHS